MVIRSKIHLFYENMSARQKKWGVRLPETTIFYMVLRGLISIRKEFWPDYAGAPFRIR